MLVWSSTTVIAAVPSPKHATRPGPLKSSGMSYSVLPSSPFSGAFTSMNPIDSPPGFTAFALRPFHTPPPCVSTRSRMVTPIGSSTQIGFSTCPARV